MRPRRLFRRIVAISGDTIVVGARGRFNRHTLVFSSYPLHIFVEDAGSAYLFVRSNGQWSQQLKLTASDPAEGDLFGDSCAISGDTIVAGAPYKNSAAARMVRLYVKLLSTPSRISSLSRRRKA